MKILTQKELFEGEISLNQGLQLGSQEYQTQIESQPQNPGLKQHVILKEGDDVTSPDEEAIFKIKRMDKFVALYSEFLETEFSLTYEELSPTIEYVSAFVGGVKFNYKLPSAFRYTKEELHKRRINLSRPNEITSLLVHNKCAGTLVRWLKTNVHQ